MTGSQRKKAREKLGLTQLELGEKLGVASNTVARWERNERTPPGKLLELALKSLKIKTPAKGA